MVEGITVDRTPTRQQSAYSLQSVKRSIPGQHAHIGPMYVYCGLVGVGTTTFIPAVARKGQLGCVWARAGLRRRLVLSSRETW